jgi:hypothetical protein
MCLQILPPSNLGIVKPYIPKTQGDITKVVLEKMDEQFLIMDNLFHFIIVDL